MASGRKVKADSEDYPIKDTAQYGRYPQLKDKAANSIMKVILEAGLLTPHAFSVLHKYVRKLENGQTGTS